MRYGLSLILALFLSFSATLQADDNEAMVLLEKMTQAAKDLNYEGVFAYQSGRKLQSIRIYHRADARGELERLISLNGAAREVIRSNDMVTCINPDDKQISVSRRPLGHGFPGDLPRRLNSAMSYYDVEMDDIDRIAGRQAHALLIKPVDNYRYGYRLWVDVESHLLLKSQLIDEKGDVLETFAFSSLNVDVHIPEHKLTSKMADGQELSWQRTEPETYIDMATADVSDWQTGWLPDGFGLVALQTRLRTSSGTNVEQRVFSDGLSTVSVFIEKMHARHNHLKGISHVGGINAYGTIIQTHFVTVVGEVPAKTVEKIGNSIAYTAVTTQ